MAAVDINGFMARFHALERDLALFEDVVDGDYWWDSVRFEVCYFLYDCLTGLAYSSVYRPVPQLRRLGSARRWVRRLALLADVQLRHRDLLMMRNARSVEAGGRRDVVLDPVAALFGEDRRIVDTMPRRFHLPDGVSAARTRIPADLDHVLARLLEAFGVDRRHLAPLAARIVRLRAEYARDVRGYERLFARARPHAILLVQNGLEKALFHVARQRGIPTIELQHGLIGFGHPAYSYARDIDYRHLTGTPTMFLTFAPFWSEGICYPNCAHAVIGTDHFGTAMGPVRQGRGAIMMISADIYHDELIALTRDLARRLPGRSLIYKLHPNQGADEAAIRASVADMPNIVVGAAGTPASRMMDDVSHLVAIQSTVVYEALQNGRRIAILPRHDHHLHADLFALPQVSVPGDVAALAAAVEVPADGTPGPVFFERFDPVRARAIIAPVLAKRR